MFTPARCRPLRDIASSETECARHPPRPTTVRRPQLSVAHCATRRRRRVAPLDRFESSRETVHRTPGAAPGALAGVLHNRPYRTSEASASLDPRPIRSDRYNCDPNETLGPTLDHAA